MRGIIKTVFVAIMLIQCGLAFADEQVNVVQPKIMVVPHTKQGEDIRAVLENDASKRIALTKIKEGFDDRGVNTVDFIAKLKSISTSNNLAEDSQTDLAKMIISQSGADVYVDAEVIYTESSSGNDVKLILTAYDAATSASLSNKVGESKKFYTNDVEKLASKAVESCIDDFLNVINSKFGEIVENGRSYQLEIAIDGASAFTLEDEIGGDTLADLIEDYVADNAYKNNYHIQGSSEKTIIFDEIRVPLFKDKDQTANYQIRDFRRPLERKLKNAGINYKTRTVGNKIVITII